MYKFIKVFLTAILLICCCSVNTQSVKACGDIMKAVSINEATACDAMKNFTKCFLRETRMHTLNSSDEELQGLKSFLQEELNKIGVKCEIDIAALSEEVREEEELGVGHVTTPPKGYTESTTIGECFDSLDAEISKQGVSCRLLPPYIKCQIRVLDIYKRTFNNTDEYTEVEMYLKQGLDKIGIDCDIDYPVLIEEVRLEQTQKNSASFVDFTFHSIVLLAFILIVFVFH
ncbi:hypothetical protein BsWGS_25295 [Bradybaena similaris]